MGSITCHCKYLHQICNSVSSKFSQICRSIFDLVTLLDLITKGPSTFGHYQQRLLAVKEFDKDNSVKQTVIFGLEYINR